MRAARHSVLIGLLGVGTWYVTSSLVLVSFDYVDPRYIRHIHVKEGDGDACISNQVFLNLEGLRSAHGGTSSHTVTLQQYI